MYKKYLSRKIFGHKQKGFTLAEIMVVLFVLTVILAAFAPMMTTRTKVNTNSPWRYSTGTDTANAYFGQNDSQRAMIGQTTGSDDAFANKLTINRPDTSDLTAAHILFKDNGDAVGQLTMTSDSVILGGSTDSVYPGDESYYTTAVGSGVLSSVISAIGNTAIGYNALNAVTTGGNNTAIGYNALNAVTTGGYNTGIGYNACSAVTSNDATTCIGYNATGATGGTTAAPRIYLGNSSTAVYVPYNSSMYELISVIELVASDQRLKNIKGENTAGLEKIKQMKTYDYTLKSDKKNTPHVGVIAQEVQKFFPEAVFKGEDGYLKISKERLFFAVINAIKELALQISDKDKKIQELEKKNAELEERLLKLEEKVETLSESKKFTFRIKKLNTDSAS